MGGYNSGRPESTAKIDAGKKLKLDQLLKQGNIKRDCHVHGTLHWTYNYSGEDAGSIGYEANLRDPADMWIRLYYTITDYWNDTHEMDYRVHLQTTPAHFGGERLWFTCPHTSRRCGALYLPPGAKKFLSRYAYPRLKYRSQAQGFEDRAINRKWRLMDKLGGSDDYWRKPKGMHETTYQRKLEEIWKAEEYCDYLLARRLGHLFGLL